MKWVVIAGSGNSWFTGLNDAWIRWRIDVLADECLISTTLPKSQWKRIDLVVYSSFRRRTMDRSFAAGDNLLYSNYILLVTSSKLTGSVSCLGGVFVISGTHFRNYGRPLSGRSIRGSSTVLLKRQWTVPSFFFAVLDLRRNLKNRYWEIAFAPLKHPLHSQSKYQLTAFFNEETVVDLLLHLHKTSCRSFIVIAFSVSSLRGVQLKVSSMSLCEWPQKKL